MSTINYSKSKRLTVRDIVTIAIIAVLYVIIRYLVAMVTIPSIKTFMILSGSICAFLGASLYLVMANRVSKTGTIFLFAVLIGIVDGLMGYLFLIVYFAICGLVAEISMLGKNSYKNPLRNTIGWTVYSLMFSFGNYIAIWFTWESYEAQALKNGLPRELLDMHRYYYTTPLWIYIISGLAIIGAILGCLFGHKILNRHFKKSGIA